MKKQEVYNFILDLAKDIAMGKEGALFVIGPRRSFSKRDYELLYPELVGGCSINEKGARKVLEKLAVLDGAVLISDRGKLIAYGARIKANKTLKGFGTRHGAAAGITSKLTGSTAILVSEEVNWIKVFNAGKVILEMDPYADTPRRVYNKIISFITDNDTALITAAGASAAFLGVTPVLVIGGTYMAIRTATGIIKRSFSKIK